MIQTMQGVSSVRLVVLGITGVILLLAFVFLSMKLTSPIKSPLYSNLSNEDSSSIATELGAMGIDFDISSGGSQILVESADVLKVRMLLAQKGLPNKGSIVGYEIFDKDTALGTSNFVLNVNLIRALEGELGRTLSSLASIKSARVHLVVPKRELFRKNKVQSSASVVLTLNNRANIPKEETYSVRQLVSAAVPGLKMSKVVVVDNTGRLLAKGSAEDNDSGFGGGNPSDSIEYRTNFETRLRKNIETLLEQVVGVDSVEAMVSAEIGFDRTVSNSEIYDPDGQVARSVQSREEKAKSSDGSDGAVGVSGNLPNAEASSASRATNTNEKLDEVTNFEISKTTTNHISEVGAIKKISVAILVDGTYKTIVNEEEDTEERVYSPRSGEELEQIKTLVKSAMGYDEERGDSIEVVNMQFNRYADQFLQEEGAFDWLKRDLDSIIKTVVAGIVAILVIMLVIRPLVVRAFDIAPIDEQAAAGGSEVSFSSDMQMMPASGGRGGMSDDMIDIDVIQSKVDNTQTRKVNELVENNPEETLSVIRNWLANK